MTRIGKREKQLLQFFSKHTDKWYTHRELCEKIGVKYNEGKLRKPLAKMVQAQILDKKQFKDNKNNQIQHWKTKDL